jgi:aminotransferase
MSKKSDSPNRLSQAKRLNNLRPSGLRRLFDLEHELAKSLNQKILSFGLGNLNIPVMKPIIDKLKEELDDPLSHRYSSNAGLMELREAIACKYQEVYNINYNHDQILITGGCLEALLDTFLALVNPGDEVLIQDPTFGYYKNQISLCGGKATTLPLNEKFELEADTLNDAITDKTKILLLNFPCNPTGSVLKRYQVKDIVETATDSGLTIISDEAYENLVYEEHVHTCAAEFNYDNVIILSSFSKSFCMTGFRIGYANGPLNLIKPISLVHQMNTACANTPGQLAANFALRSPPSIREPMMQELNLRRKETISAFTKIKGISLNYNPLGAFYIYPNVKGTGMDGTEFSEFLLREAKIVVVPGNEFGDCTNDHVRISYGFLSVPEIKEAGKRLETYLN